ncbi:stressosome-associated protein Prli42 [Paenibacillaceae bacterium WGS1546]
MNRRVFKIVVYATLLAMVVTTLLMGVGAMME